MKKTKIICTMGPTTNDRAVMKQLAESGMDIARFNFSHGDYEEQKGRMDMLKSVREEIRRPIAILLDTKGPEIRTGLLKEGKKVTLIEVDGELYFEGFVPQVQEEKQAEAVAKKATKKKNKK